MNTPLIVLMPNNTSRELKQLKNDLAQLVMRRAKEMFDEAASHRDSNWTIYSKYFYKGCQLEDIAEALEKILPMSRKLSKQEEEAIEEFYARKQRHEPTRGFVTVAAPITLKKWNGQHPVEKNQTPVIIPVGQTLQIVMVSRFDDCGLTDDLNTDFNYHTRMNFNDPRICDIRLTKEPTI